MPIPATMAAPKKKHGVGYDMINIAGSPTKESPKESGHQTSRNGAGDPLFTPLPPLPSLVSNHNDFVQATEDAPTPTFLSVSTPHLSQTGKSGPTSRMGIPLIVLLSVGIGFFLLGVYLVFRFCTRPRRDSRIRPSLPIREKSFVYDEEAFGHDGRESDLFGGKERSASRLTGDAPLWTWVQYAKPEIKEQTNNRTSLLQPPERPAVEETVVVNTVPPSPLQEALVNRKRASAALLPLATTQHNPVSSQLPRNRLSAASLYRNRDSKEIGVAITGDGYPIMERSRSKLARRSQSHSALGERRRRDSAYRPDAAYEGADVSSPTTYFQPVATPKLGASPTTGAEGRARIQSSYYAVAPYPRLSSMPPSYSIGTARKVHISKAYATEQRNEVLEETAGQESAGDSPYLPTSPQATLYPDDSMSVIAASRQKRRSQLDLKRASKYGALEATTTQGLLEMDFGVSRMSISELAEGNLKVDDKYTRPFQSNLHRSDSQRNAARAQDRPPRVPSPPPLPSLTQMALAHSNPDAHSNYRSPTYSIYGLYGPDRKSGVTNLA